MPKILSIIIPAYNESQTIKIILNNILKVDLPDGFKKEIIVVNDASTDDTGNVLQTFVSEHSEIKIKIIDKKINSGKGAAIHSDIEFATGDYIIIQDADTEYDPREYSRLLQPVLDGFADVVYGSRFMGGEPHRILFFWHSLGNKLLTTLSNMFTNLNLTDMESCYKLFKADILKGLYLKEKRFGFEPEVTAKVVRIPAVRIYEVGISYYGRTYQEGKKINWRDGFHAIYCVIRYNLFDKKYKK